MVPDDCIVTEEGYIIVNGVAFEDLDAYYDYID